MGNTMDKSDFVGLENQGATCYLNTLLQTWFMTPEVRECITSAKSDAALVCVLQDLFNNLEGSENTSLRTDELTTLLRMNVYQQHDIEECFRNMINKLHTAMEPEQNILKFYQINMVQSLKCSWCTSHIQIDCPFLDLPLLIHSANSSRKFEHLEMALREFLKEQTMEDDNACYCDNCDTKTKTKTRYYFNHLPRILTFQLKRVNIDGFRMRYQKINDYVTLPLSIEFNKSQDNCNEWILKATRGKVRKQQEEK
ncbi:ubiquitin carboxyl-terminal hydrolase 47-like [Rhinoraja longicauda]